MSAQQVITVQNSSELTDETVGMLIQAGVIPQNTPKSQISVFAQVCREKGLSPFSKEIYLMNYGGVYSRIVGVDGFRKIAARTKQLAGCDDVKFDVKSDGSWFTAADLSEKKQLPKSATVTVYRIVGGLRVGFTHTAVFSEFSTGKQKWQTMPFQMIAKVAECFAYKKGFADELSGLNVEEEAGAYTDAQVQTQPKVIDKKPPLTPNTEIWQTAKKAIEDAMNRGRIFSIEDIRERYEITEEHFDLLMK